MGVDRTPGTDGRRRALLAIMAFVGLLLLGGFAFARPGNPVLSTLAFGACAVFLTRLVIEMLGRLFGVHTVELDRYRREEVLEYLALVRKASAASKGGRFDEAVVALEAADNLQPGRLDVALPLAEALRRTCRLDEAVRLLEALKVLHAGNPTLHYELARSLCLSGDLDEAQEELEVGAAVDPKLWVKAADEHDLRALRDRVVRRRKSLD